MQESTSFTGDFILCFACAPQTYYCSSLAVRLNVNAPITLIVKLCAIFTTQSFRLVMFDKSSN